MLEKTDEKTYQQSFIHSYLGHKCISEGNVDSIKYLHGNICLEHPPLIETISLLQLNLTAMEIMEDTRHTYGDEFLYYYGMACLGELSPLIVRDLNTAEGCFEKIRMNVPKINARLAYINLLKSTDPHKSDKNINRISVLRKWAGKKDIFSMIVLAKIVCEHFLLEEQSDDMSMPLLALKLLEVPCQIGHPVAIKFYNAVMDDLDAKGVANARSRKLDTSRINVAALYDY